MGADRDRQQLPTEAPESSIAASSGAMSTIRSVEAAEGGLTKGLGFTGNRAAIGYLTGGQAQPPVRQVIHPAEAIRLQRTIGNRALSGLIVQRSPALVQRAGDHEHGDSRGSSWKDIDKRANDRRLAQAREDYQFDKSLKGPESGVTAADRGANAENAEKVKGRLAEQSNQVRSENDVPWPPPDLFFLKYAEDADKAVQHFIQENKLAGTPNQIATVHARAKHKENIPKPEALLPPAAIAAHLGKFVNGAHAFIDPTASKKIEGEITDVRFKGWGVDANFVAPLDEANALNAKAHRERGIETIEDELGIPGKYWSKSEWNPEKYLVRWIIPKPKLKIDSDDDDVVLEMAKGVEWGADSSLWVAGGLTKGGASEAVLKAIPREQLIKMLAKGKIKQVREYYPETRDDIT